MQQVFTAAPHHDVLALVFQIALLLLAARALGEVAQRLGQPAVVGEILAGIILGPSLLSGFFPALGAVGRAADAGPGLPAGGGRLCRRDVPPPDHRAGDGPAADPPAGAHGHGRLLGGIVVPFATGYALGD